MTREKPPRRWNSTIAIGPVAPRARSSKTRKRGPVKKRGWKLKVRNAARRKKEFARTYHSVERVEVVKTMPCAACSVVGYSENAHVCGVEGMGRKGSYRTIAPLCGPLPMFRGGCHRLFDEHRAAFDADHPDFNPETAAAACESAWLSHLARGNAAA